MSVINGVWHSAAIELPTENETVLAVKELKNGTRDICLARCIPFYERYNQVTREKEIGPYWITGGNNNILYWMPLPKMPEK